MVLRAPRADEKVIDPRTGTFTREILLFFSQLIDAIGTIGSVVGTTDTQTLTNKTIDGDDNTLSDIATSSLKSTTGSDASVVTGTAGADGFLAAWDANGDAVDGGILGNTVVQDGEEQSFVRLQVYTVSTLPSGSEGMVAYASDLRVFDGAGTQETGGNGTGGVVSHNGSNWVVIGTNSTAAA